MLRIHGIKEELRKSFILQKCTYGNKCKFRHPERGPYPQKSVTEKLVEHVQKHLQARNSTSNLSSSSNASSKTHQPLCKSRSTATSTVQPPASVAKSKSVENVAIEQPAVIPGAHETQVSPTTSSQGN